MICLLLREAERDVYVMLLLPLSSPPSLFLLFSSYLPSFLPLVIMLINTSGIAGCWAIRIPCFHDDGVVCVSAVTVAMATVYAFYGLHIHRGEGGMVILEEGRVECGPLRGGTLMVDAVTWEDCRGFGQLCSPPLVTGGS